MAQYDRRCGGRVCWGSLTVAVPIFITIGAVCAAAVSAPRPVARPVPTGGLASTGLPVGLAAAALLLLLGAATAVRVRSAR